ncbi:NAD(P)-binding protein [Schizopora paradoxa]|uniref:NAD(P)-binding protein n=1 Tax=Schizopora paradoxa TaxID=27342 RepID=A0A0H2SI36_9AGAM|nr:NAD(P)-binding protein [Schizopora paradoxa]
MTISKDSSAPIFVVVGSTGGQGGSVVRAIQESSKPYRVRAITRDAAKPKAKELASLGCEVVEADISTPDGAKKAFEGADFAFAMTLTDFEVANPLDKEFADAKSQIDAAKAACAKTLIWSGATHIKDGSGGKNSIATFENKAAVTAYARSLGGLKIIDVQPGNFLSNYFTHMRPRKLEDGSFVMGMALDANTKIPLIDLEADYGKYVVAALEDGSLETVHAAPEYITPVQVAAGFAKATGKKVFFAPVPDEQLKAILTQTRGEILAVNMVAMFRAFREAGYYCGADLAPSNKMLSKPARKFDEMLAANPTGVAELFA